ncbi:MAG: hypothetical protein EP329_18575 [Deltaproteobacteria bacterium]|nr:MAG: hypothetical protein EP329_18575 [Deltaproteobacteria bacterium]
MRSTDRKRLDRLTTTADGVCPLCGRGPTADAQQPELTDEEVAEILILAADMAKYIGFDELDPGTAGRE